MDASQGGIQLVSRMIYKSLDIDVSVLMGANIASEVANEDFCESTLGMPLPLTNVNCQVLF